jgi:glycosyltransferase involved in cell wall biosynthesis
LLLKIAVYRNVKVVWHIHSVAKLSWRQRIKDLIKLQLFARHFGDLFIAVGDGAYRNAIDRGFPRAKLFLNHNGIDISRFADSGERRDQRVHSSRMNSSGQKVFLLLGYNPLIKGVDVFIKAAEKLSQDSQCQNIFLIVGRQTTREFVSSLPQSKQLDRTLKIIDPTDDFSALLGDIDVLVASSRSEGFGYAVIEAMAAGKLILCSDIPGVRDTYGRSEGVWLFPTEDWESLAGLMQKAASLSYAERQHLGHINSRYASTHYSLDVWVKKMGQIYDSLLNAGPNEGPVK